MDEPVLVVMAAGMGSRYGGLKQMDPIGPRGQVILDYSIFDALRGGFKKVVFVIKEEMEEDFRRLVLDRVSRHIETEVCFQRMDDLPGDFAVPAGRVKPWGTGHAVLAARKAVHGPFAVVNADDFYGPEAYRLVYEHLRDHPDGEKYSYAMVGYILENTLTENGHVARGVCSVTADGVLRSITERTRIELRGGTPCYTEDGESWHPLPAGATVSMNLFGLTAGFMEEAWARFEDFLHSPALEANPLKAEFYLPGVVSGLINADKAQVHILRCAERWYGVTYREDKPVVAAVLARMEKEGIYPAHMLGL